jgi:branched-chain amino acid transport system substrate-binding protein
VNISHKSAAAAIAVVSALALAGCAEAGDAGQDGDGPIVIGIDTALSGTIGALGQQNLNALELYFDKVNEEGGVLGRQVELISVDDAADPATATTNVQNLINDNEVVSIFGPVSSATAVAESKVADQYEIPVINTISNDIALSTTGYSDWVFQFVPNSHMEALAVAEYVGTSHEGSTGVRIATIAPDYNQGHTTVDEFAEAVEASGVGTVVDEQYPALGTTDFSNNIAALLASDPDVVFAVISGNDLVTWTKQAESFGLFDKAEVIAPYGWNLLQVMGDQIPEGVATYSRAPFFAIDDPEVADFADEYHSRYGEWPTDWSLLGYGGAQMWVQAVEAAGEATPAAIQKALASITGKTVLGDIQFRECDHQAPLAEYVGPLTKDLDPTYGFKVFESVTVVDADRTMFTCEEASAGR